MPPPPRERRAESGQASVEFVALLPLLVVVVVALWQLAIAGQTIWLAGTAARAAARAQAVGGNVGEAARGALPGGLRPRLHVRAAGDHGVVVHIDIPSVLGHVHLGTASARAHFTDQQASS